jgi:endonuclease YncB( thermonuclease family)
VPVAARAMMPSHSLVIVVSAVFLLARYALAGEVSVIDGDGLRIGGERIRLWGIDAPELDQECSRDQTVYPCGAEARDVLDRLLGAGMPSCQRLYDDAYGRTVARCSIAAVDLGAEMVRLGWAVDFRRYSNGAYADEEAKARAAKRGLWAGEFELQRSGAGHISRKTRHSFCHKFATSRNGPKETMADFCGFPRTPVLWQKRPRGTAFFP